ncbi:DUF6942 family protein [Amphritea sp. HPY]|uniref:DUF6942 family protein n=1 Tax=Amphritea sp. HPY TaxID=3421652 RepID=UPI003D7D2F48
MTISHLGNLEQAETILYLPAPPILPTGDTLNLPELIKINGNHWRKILTIYAKLCCTKGRWQDYRDQKLLHNVDAISFANQLIDNQNPRCSHIVAGKASWARLGIEPSQLDDIDAEGMAKSCAYKKGQLILTPYPDYRQFPNALIEQVKHVLQG